MEHLPNTVLKLEITAALLRWEPSEGCGSAGVYLKAWSRMKQNGISRGPHFTRWPVPMRDEFRALSPRIRKLAASAWGKTSERCGANDLEIDLQAGPSGPPAHKAPMRETDGAMGFSYRLWRFWMTPDSSRDE
jgi:hypothetical protein